MKTSGSCLCGDVAFEYAGEFQKFFLCHCGYCRKSSGSAHGANLFGRDGKLVWLRGQDQVTSFKLADTRFQRCFCSRCGAGLPYQLNEKLVVVPAGSLDVDASLMPQAHLFIASKANWDAALGELPCFEGFPS